jgi:hypothetical protein
MTKDGLVWVEPSKTTVEGLATLIDALTKRVDTAEKDIDALEVAVGVAAKPESAEGVGDAVAATGLFKALDDEIARATGAEQALSDRIAAIDFIDETELATALGDYVTTETFNGFKDTNTQAIADAKSGAETTAANALSAARTEISKEIDDDVKVAKDRADEAYTLASGKVDSETYATDKKALEDEDAAIRAIAEAAKSSIDTFLNSEEVDATVNTLKEIKAEIDKMTDATELTTALASKADNSTVEGIDTRVKAIEDAPYVTKSQLDAVDGKFGSYTNTEELTTLLAGKQDNIPENTYDAYGAAATAKSEAIADAESKIATAKQEAIGDAATAAAGIYATKTALSDLETALDGRLDTLEAYDHSTYATKDELTAHGTAADAKYATKEELKTTDDKTVSNANAITNLTGRLDGIVAQGGEPNVINNISVNGTVQEIANKTVDITVPTKVSDLTDDTGFDARITAAQNQADKGVSDAAAAQTKANDAATAAANNATALGELTTTVAGHTESINAHAGRLTALENADTAHAAEYTTLKGIVDGHTESIAKKADTTVVDGISAKASANEAAIETLNKTTIPGINTEVAKKANADSVYSITAMDAIIGTRTDGKSVVEMIAAAQTAATYDDTQVKADIAANAAAITKLNGDDKTEGSVDYKVAQEVAKILNDNDDSDIDTLNEIAAWITNDTTGAAKMNADIATNAAAIAKLNGDADTEGSVLAMIAAAAPGVATIEAAGLVKSVASTVENGVSVATDGTMSVNSVNVNKLVQTASDTLILNGGSAAVATVE